MSNLDHNQTSKTALASKGSNDVVLFERPDLSASVYQVEQHPLKMVELEISLSSTKAEGLEKNQTAIYETLRRLIRRGMTAYVLSAELIESKGSRYEKGFREFSYQNVDGDTYSTGISFLPTIEGYTYLVQNWGAIILRLRNLLGGEVGADKAEGLLAQKTEVVEMTGRLLQSQGFVETKAEGGEMGELSIVNMVSSDGLTMSSREIADLVGSRHDSVRRTIERLAESGVIALPPMVEKSTAGRPSLEYVFSGDQGKRDSLVVVAQLSPEFTGDLVDRWQELEAKVEKPKPQEDKALSSKVAAELAIMQCYTEMLKPAPSSQLYMLQRIATNNKLDSSFLPDYTVDAPTDNSGGSSLPTAPVTTLLKENGIKESPATYNKMMQRAGILEKRQRRSTTSDSGTKDFWSITTEGLIYGKNITNPRNPRETQPHWYVDRFDELHGVVSRVGA